ncbi:dihydrolipoyllysine-residue acetyltransferase [Thiopseudomonas alkaliphila]|uniref:dihydrolipoyllysine-residue acetyltransferase n=1 Tax=Thiopseudomonas alkaliphila TaxID=1697053 RepID=UPI00069FC491|nr:dihydrolipoyllysine-residue acetyltransferase [Thiopseudomonas alkaliphila]AKX51462.1 dihydrolipoamide acetyltransferase [Thiopseudomonas alkaliphila]AKX57805.1 dihydrolipoamide acetyltransferase [Thiopseudomonas alkaliphila]
MSIELIRVPDIGNGEGEVIELFVKVGDEIEAEQSLLTLESDKASMEIPAPKAGIIKSLKVQLGDRLKEGDELLELEVESAAVETTESAEQSQLTTEQASEEQAESSVAPAVKSATEISAEEQEIKVPDIGSTGKARVIELMVAVGDQVQAEDSLLTLESDKASMEIPSPVAGEITEVLVRLDAEVGAGDLIFKIKTQVAASEAEATPDTTAPATESMTPAEPIDTATSVSVAPISQPTKPAKAKSQVHAGPAVRKLAREFGVDLGLVTATGPHDRIVKEDVQLYVQTVLSKQKAASGEAPGAGIPPIPEVDFSRFGEVEEVAMTRLQQIGATNLHRSWLNVPHVTQFESADISELEKFRVAQKVVAEQAGVKLTILPFLLKACAHLLKEMPDFNSSLAPSGTALIRKKYVHLGFAVDTPEGLLVPVIRDVDQKSLLQLAAEAAELADKARNKKLSPDQMQGACFTISSLGHIGGTGFTPIVNAPEVAILGVSRATMQPVWNGNKFKPRLLLPLSLSYDHRVINGAAAAQFTRRLSDLLAEIRSLLL